MSVSPALKAVLDQALEQVRAERAQTIGRKRSILSRIDRALDEVVPHAFGVLHRAVEMHHRASYTEERPMLEMGVIDLGGEA